MAAHDRPVVLGPADRGKPATQVLRLRDGRRLAYTELGDPDGVPVVHQHGMPGSRLEHVAEPELYRLMGVRVITPDRPGYGLSDPQPRRRLLDWPSDVAELANSLGIPRFGIIGLSGGGIYALACAAAIPQRVTEVVVTGCPGPMQRAGALAGMRFMTRAGVWLGSRAPWLLDAGAAVLSGLVRRYPRFFVDHFNDGMPPADRRWLSMPSVNSGAADTIREALRPGAWGYVQDIRVLARPWDFALEDIRVPVQLWHGDEDRVIPLHHGRYLASVIPGATLRICPGEAHMVMWNHLAEILMAAAGMPPHPARTRELPSISPVTAGSSDSAADVRPDGHSPHPENEVNRHVQAHPGRNRRFYVFTTGATHGGGGRSEVQ
jgi:pimeloyl-ACP methyl ester carboxylesterase